MLRTSGYPPDVDSVGAPVIGADFLDNKFKTLGSEEEIAVGSATDERVGFLDRAHTSRTKDRIRRARTYEEGRKDPERYSLLPMRVGHRSLVRDGNSIERSVCI